MTPTPLIWSQNLSLLGAGVPLEAGEQADDEPHVITVCRLHPGFQTRGLHYLDQLLAPVIHDNSAGAHRSSASSWSSAEESAHCTGNAPEPEQIITNLCNAPRTMRGSATPLKTTAGRTICCWSTCSSSRRRSKWTSCPLSAPSRYVVSGPIGELVNITTN